MNNHFDNLAVDVEKLYTEVPVMAGKSKKMPNWTRSMFHRIYQASFVPLRTREYVWHAFHRTNLDQTWFEIFAKYWTSHLHGRPLWGVQDFYFLQGMYRLKFQQSEVADTMDSKVHLDAWQKPEVLYQLLHLVYKESILNELNVLRLLWKYRPRASRLLEFGCATAPITTTLFEFWPASNVKVYITDIKTLAFHYAAYKFKDTSAVVPFALEAKDNFLLSLPEPVDAIFCLTVFEHLNQPLKTAEKFFEYLKPGGLLIFDYLKGDGEGLDTHHAVRERQAVLAYIREHFEILVGDVQPEKNVSLTVARKR